MCVQILAQQVVYPFADHFDVSLSLKENSKALPQIADTFSKQTINEQTNNTRMRFEDHIYCRLTNDFNIIPNRCFSGASVASNSKISTFATLLFLMVGN